MYYFIQEYKKHTKCIKTIYINNVTLIVSHQFVVTVHVGSVSFIKFIKKEFQFLKNSFYRVQDLPVRSKMFVWNLHGGIIESYVNKLTPDVILLVYLLLSHPLALPPSFSFLPYSYRACERSNIAICVWNIQLISWKGCGVMLQLIQSVVFVDGINAIRCASVAAVISVSNPADILSEETKQKRVD